MAGSKKPRKKYNPHRVMNRVVEKHSARYLVAHCWLHKSSYFYDLEGRPARPSLTVQKKIKDVPMTWSVSCLIMCRDKNGKNKIKIMDVTAPRHPDVLDEQGNVVKEGALIPVKYTNLAPSFCREHMEFIREFQEKHLETYMGYGWVAAPSGVELSEELLYNIMDWQGVWKERAIWEELKEKEEKSNEQIQATH